MGIDLFSFYGGYLLGHSATHPIEPLAATLKALAASLTC